MIQQTFKTTLHPLFIPFIMAGHPTQDMTVQAILALAAAGADMIELGVPFSDPLADGPVNQQAAEKALEQGTCMEDVLSIVKQVREQNCQTPLILFSYLNPIHSFGYEAFAIQAKAAGINGVLIVDLPPEEGLDIYKNFQDEGLEIILLASPTTRTHRFELYRQMNPGFLYYISRLAVTGMQQDLSQTLEKDMEALRTHFPHTPIVVGFGISTPEQAGHVACYANGVIVGSALVKMLEEQGLEAFKQLAQEMAEQVHGALNLGARTK